MKYEDFAVVCASVLKRFVCLPAGGFFLALRAAQTCIGKQTPAMLGGTSSQCLTNRWILIPTFISEYSVMFPNYFFCLIQVMRCSRGQDGKMSSEFIRIGKKKKTVTIKYDTSAHLNARATNRSLYFNVVIKCIRIPRNVFSKGHFYFRVLNVVLESQFGRPNLWWRHLSYVIISVSVCFSVPETLNLWWYERSQVRSLGTKVHTGLRWSSSGFQT